MKFLEIFKRNKEENKYNFDNHVLKKNDISLLILDERWNSLFNIDAKTAEIMNYEQQLKELIKEEARLIAEQKSITQKKKDALNTIRSLTDEVYNNNNAQAAEIMQECQKQVTYINQRLETVDDELYVIPKRIRDVNVKLLELTVNLVYKKIRASQKRVQELTPKIEEMKVQLREYIAEREELLDISEISYSYFHDLLGAEVLERLDKKFLE